MKMQFNTLPDKLIECALWCVWKYEDRDGKPTKVPYNPRTGGRAQSNNPATFSDFKTAVAAFGTCKYDGMGIGVFPPFAAIDIDHCVENGILSPLASDIVTHSKSYTEYSPSGKGVRIILTVPDGFKYDKARYYINNQKKGLEVYVSGSTQKFVTITGNKISGDTIQDGESPLRFVCEKYMERVTQKPKTKPQRKPATHRATMTGDYWLDMGMKKDPCLSDYWNGKFPMENESEKDAALAEQPQQAAERAELRDKITSRKQEIQRLRGIVRSLYENLIQGVLTKEEYFDYKEKYENEIADITLEARQLEDGLRTMDEQIEQYRALARDAESIKADRELTAALIERLIDRIEVSHDKQITVCYRFQSEFENYVEVLKQCRNM